MGTKPRRHTLRIIDRRWLSPGTFEARFMRPMGFRFAAGQKIRFLIDEKCEGSRVFTEIFH